MQKLIAFNVCAHDNSVYE